MIQTIVQIINTPAHCGHFPSDRALRTEAPEMLLIAFQPVVETMEKTTTRRLPQYPKEYRLIELVCYLIANSTWDILRECCHAQTCQAERGGPGWEETRSNVHHKNDDETFPERQSHAPTNHACGQRSHCHIGTQPGAN